ncbi:MAG: hybrid sensor histidine kinase/response regulator [Leptospiraceae bacterium]|nr:hybrid sensor histidine kinase/response regulator [Leptospiraceae bacterium]MCP5495727.1 hybrid sensor histidine kinase/response regulator [Leptospiraceae bacterium]
MDIQELKNSTILIVDDNPTNLGVLFDYLSNLGFNVLVSQDGENALALVQDERPDIILLDIMMPGIDGFEVCKRLKSIPIVKDIPIIFISALSETFDKVTGFEIGGVDYITKPFQQEEVLARISSHLTIQKQRQKLHELNSSKDRFFSIVANDLRSPIASIIRVTKELQDSLSTWDKELISKITKDLNDTSQNTYSFVENLLEWSRIQLGLIDCTPLKVYLHDIMLNNLKMNRKIIDQKKFIIENNIDPSAYVYADRYMVNIVIKNLLSNAFKFTNRNGKIEINAKQKEESLTISIIDTGIGIIQENLSKLFMIDKPVKQYGTEGERGTGLGLILCQNFIKRNYGKIWVESEFGRGTNVSFTLPLSPHTIEVKQTKSKLKVNKDS